MPDRRDERTELCRLLRLGSSVHMLAPRRIGKTWLMHRVDEDLRCEGWVTVFVDVEGMQTEEEFLRALCGQIQGAGTTSEKVVGHLTQRLRQLISGGWEGNPIHAIGRVDAKEFAEALIAALDAQRKDTLILIDEIALFVMARLNEDVPQTAALLYHLRRLRQSYPRVRWLLTGSIGLDVVARRHRLLGAFVDLETFPLLPFSEAAAFAYLEKLCREDALRRKFYLDRAAFDHLARQLGWLVPYYLKLVGDRIRPTGDTVINGRRLATVDDIDRALDELLKPEYRTHFATWEEHLVKNFPEIESKELHGILAICCEQPEGETSATILARLSETHPNLLPSGLMNKLTALANAGFLHEVDARWRFCSGLLRRYWLKYFHE